MAIPTLGGFVAQQDEVLFPEDFAPSSFFDSKISDVLGYLPMVGVVVGVARIIFSAFQLITQPYSREMRDKYMAQIFRGVLEGLSLGIGLLLYDIFRRVQLPPAEHPPQTVHSLFLRV